MHHYITIPLGITTAPYNVIPFEVLNINISLSTPKSIIAAPFF